MRAPLPLASYLLGIAVLSQAVVAGDAEGCRDLKLWPRVEGCVIVECAAKQHDTISIQNSDGPALDLATNSITYSCPAPVDPKRIEGEVDLLLHKSAYQTVSEDKSDPASVGVTARKGGKWVRWNISSEDGVSTYSVVTGDSGTERLKVEACNDSILSLPAHCVVTECTFKSEDAVDIRTNQEEHFSLEGPLLTATLTCPASSAAQIFASAQKELKESGFDILFTDQEHPESSWLTARSGKRWVELVGASDGESTSYALTVVPSAEAVVPVKSSSTSPPDSSESSPTINAVPAGESVKLGSVAQASADHANMASTLAPLQPELPKEAQPVPAPQAETFKETDSPPIVSSSEPSLTTSTPAPKLVAPATAGAELIPPKPILQVPMEVSHDLKWSIVGRVVINMLVDVNEEGVVTKAIVTGKVTRDVEKLQNAAVNAIYRWRFEPAHKGDQRVPAKTTVQIPFEGLPRLY